MSTCSDVGVTCINFENIHVDCRSTVMSTYCDVEIPLCRGSVNTFGFIMVINSMSSTPPFKYLKYLFRVIKYNYNGISNSGTRPLHNFDIILKYL